MFDQEKVFAEFGITAINSGTYCSATGWINGSDDQRFDAIDPCTDESVAQVWSSTAADYEAIIRCAVDAQREWRLVPAPRRGDLVMRVAQRCQEHHDALGAIVAIDTGKSLMEGKSECKELIDMGTMSAGQARMMYGYSQQSQRPQHRMYDQWLPLGVVGVISAYNFPAAVWAQNAFLSVIGGNTVIWKPSPKVPLTAIAIQKLTNEVCNEMGHPGVFSLFMPKDNPTAQLIVEDSRIAMISFTGSSKVGRDIAQIVSGNLARRYMLECSGNNGCIVDETADLKLAARSLTFGAVGTTGQRCTSTRRVIAHHSIVKPLTDYLRHSFDAVTIGNPRNKSTLVGPLIDKPALTDFEETVAEAVALGGEIICGGKRMDCDGYFVEATIIANAQPHWPCVQRETFAPIVFVMAYDSLDEAIDIHNGVAQGLASGIHSSNIHSIEKFLSAEGSDCGIAKVNMGTTGADIGAAFGGEKETGGGRTAGSDAWKGYMRRQSVAVNWGHGSPWDKIIGPLENESQRTRNCGDWGVATA